MFRIGFTQRVEHLAERNERRDCADQAWTELLLRGGFLPIPIPNLLDDSTMFTLELQLDGVILTGGNDLAHLPDARDVAPERDALEHSLIDHCATVKIPLLGVCRGMHMIVDHYGGRLRRLDGHVGVMHGLSTTDAGADILPNGREVNSFHGFGVLREDLGGELQALAVAPDGSVEAVVCPNAMQWGIMWHPERGPGDPSDVDLLRDIFAGVSV